MLIQIFNAAEANEVTQSNPARKSKMIRINANEPDILFAEHYEIIYALWDGDTAVYISVFTCRFKIMPGSFGTFINCKNITAGMVQNVFEITI